MLISDTEKAADAEAADAEASYNLHLSDILLPLSCGEYAKIRDERYTSLHIAVGRHDTPTMALLLRLAAKADAEATTSHGWTPLMLSAMNGYTEACTMLQDHGVDEGARCQDGKTAEGHAPEMFQRYWDDQELIDYSETDYYGHNGYG